LHPASIPPRGRTLPEFREYPGSDLHDRYILADAELIILGHGLKDLGNRDSFIIRIPDSLSPDINLSVGSAFNKKWASSKLIP
jgi:hypothetical protein